MTTGSIGGSSLTAELSARGHACAGRHPGPPHGGAPTCKENSPRSRGPATCPGSRGEDSKVKETIFWPWRHTALQQSATSKGLRGVTENQPAHGYLLNTYCVLGTVLEFENERQSLS